MESDGVTFVASAGDSVGTQYPAASPNVLSVGGTSLTLNGTSGNYQSETTWYTNSTEATGGGISTLESRPGYQNPVSAAVGAYRGTPDVAFDADPGTGVAVYDSYNGGLSNPWIRTGGTSLAAPAWAGLIVIADQGRIAAGLHSLDGPSQTLPEIYTISQYGSFHDITTGNNGSISAATGYDLVTGVGTPNAQLLVPDLVHWSEVTSLTATAMVADSSGNLFASFSTGTAGIWERVANNTTWTQVFTSNASLLAVDNSGDIFAVFPGIAGIYEKAPGGSFTSIFTSSTSLLAVDGAGDVFAVFPGLAGIWEKAPGGSFTSIFSSSATLMTVDRAGNVFAVFPGLGGTWEKLTTSSNFNQITSLTATVMTTDTAGDFCASFSTVAGLSEEQRSVGTSWYTLCGTSVTLMAGYDGGDLFATFASGLGTWKRSA